MQTDDQRDLPMDTPLTYGHAVSFEEIIMLCQDIGRANIHHATRPILTRLDRDTFVTPR